MTFPPVVMKESLALIWQCSCSGHHGNEEPKGPESSLRLMILLSSSGAGSSLSFLLTILFLQYLKNSHFFKGVKKSVVKRKSVYCL